MMPRTNPMTCLCPRLIDCKRVSHRATRTAIICRLIRRPLTQSIKTMALNTTTTTPAPSILIDSDEEFYDSDEEEEHVMGPATKPVSLRDAITSASKQILAKTLLEICGHNEASKELATTLLAPSHAPLSPRGTKRKASQAEEVERMHERCRTKFDHTTQITKNCRYHPDKLRYFGVNCEFVVAAV